MYKRLIDNKKQRLYKNVWRLCKNVFVTFDTVKCTQKCIFAKQRVHFSLENIQQHKLCKARTICGNCGKVLDDCAYVLLNKIYAP